MVETSARKTHKDIVGGWHPFSPEEINTYVSRRIWRNLTARDILERNLSAIPDKVAIIDDARGVTWRDLARESNRLALRFRQSGLQYGDFVVVISPNVAEFYYIFFALTSIGVIPVMGLPRHRRVEVSHMITLHQARAIVVPTGEKFDYVGMVEEIRGDAPSLKLFFTIGGGPARGWFSTEQMMKESIERPFPPGYLSECTPDPNDILVEQLTNGTTGLPKGIPYTHNEYICLWDYACRRAGLTDESVFLCVTPVPHNMAFIAAAGPMFFRGGTLVITRSTRPEDHFRLIEKHKVTHTALVPLYISRWMEAEEAMRKHDLSSLKYIECGSQKTGPELIQWCIEKVGVNFCHCLGMTEGFHMSTRWDSPVEAQRNTVGRPWIIDECSAVRLLDAQNREVRQGEVGELVVKGPTTLKGYFRNPEENARSFDQEGFFHTGDLVCQRPDGRYVVVGRKKDLIKRGGENVSPEAVETYLIKYPGVSSVVVVAMPDAALGERLCAFVQLKKEYNVTLREMQAFMNQQGIAVFQWPERIEVVSGWPVVGNKISRRHLRGYITAKLFQEGAINKETGNEFLRKDDLTVDGILSGQLKIDFTGLL